MLGGVIPQTNITARIFCPRRTTIWRNSHPGWTPLWHTNGYTTQKP